MYFFSIIDLIFTQLSLRLTQLNLRAQTEDITDFINANNIKKKIRTKTEKLVNENIALAIDVGEEELQLPVTDFQVNTKYNTISAKTVNLVNVFFD